MLDLSRIEGFDWDDGNSRKSSDKHSVSQEEAEQVFLSKNLLVSEDIGHSQSEPRFNALGQTLGGRRLHVTFTLRVNGTRLRVISAREMNRKERTRYETQA